MSNTKSKLDGKLDELVEAIIAGKTYEKIATELNVAMSTLFAFMAKSENTARVREAAEFSAHTYADKAESVLVNAKGNLVEIQRAKELSHHYRWKSSKRLPKTYGEKVDVEISDNRIKVNVPEE